MKIRWMSPVSSLWLPDIKSSGIGNSPSSGRIPRLRVRREKQSRIAMTWPRLRRRRRRAKEEVVAVKGEFSKQQLLSMIIPEARKSKNKGSKDAKEELEIKKAFPTS